MPSFNIRQIRFPRPPRFLMLRLAGLAQGLRGWRALRALEESEALNRGALQSLPAHIAVVDRTGRIVAVNRAWRRFADENGAGGASSVKEGANYLAVCRKAADLHDPLAARALEGIGNVLAGRSGTFTLEYPCHGPGEERWFLMTAVPLGESGTSGAVIAHQNISERREAEARLKQTVDELVRSNQELEQFASVTSHDLQEPLRMVQAFTGLVQERYKGKLDAQADEYLAFALEGATRMNVLIDDLLAYSRVGSKPRLKEQVQVQDGLDAALLQLKETLSASGAVVRQEAMPVLKADGPLLGQVFQNLISNAVKYRRPGVAPEIRVAARKTGADWLFSVADNGIGIDPAYKERIFEIFQRLHTREDYEGTGIGLAICRKIVERHGGKIWVEPAETGGSIFFFTIPA